MLGDFEEVQYMEQMQIADYIITPDEHDLDADSLFVAIREWRPGIRQIIAEDFEEIGDRPGMFYLKVRDRLKGINYTSGKGLIVRDRPGCIEIRRNGLEAVRLSWPKVVADIVRMIKWERWIGRIEAKAEKAAAEKLKAEACRPAWNLGGKENEG